MYGRCTTGRPRRLHVITDVHVSMYGDAGPVHGGRAERGERPSMIMRRIATVGLTVLVAVAAAATGAVAEPSGTPNGETPKPVVSEPDIFPGAQLGVRTGPLATSVPDIGTKALTGG